VQVAILKEQMTGETRVPVIPSDVAKFIKLGAEILVESNSGDTIDATDADYQAAGAKIVNDRQKLLSADIVLRLRKPPLEDIALLKKGAVHISFLDPFNEEELVNTLAKQSISAISMEMIPRTTLAQKMDAISSQASIGGYEAVMLGAQHLKKILPMMMTPAGTISPSRVFIIGVGVAGLQAIATAKRLGARVEAFDTRPVVKEQVQSLGAKFIQIDLGETGEDKNGYAKALTEEQIAKQQEGMAKICGQSDLVITTAKLFGRKAPILITSDMIARMKPGSVIVDMAVETGGNVEGEVVKINGIKIIGLDPLPCFAPETSSQMYSSNLYNLIAQYWNKETKEFELKRDDEIIKGCLITYNGNIVNDRLKENL